MAANLALLVDDVPCVVSLHGHRGPELRQAVAHVLRAGKAAVVDDAPTPLPSGVSVGGVVRRWAETHGLPDDITTHILHAATHKPAPEAPPAPAHKQHWYHRATSTRRRGIRPSDDAPRRGTSWLQHKAQHLYDDDIRPAEHAIERKARHLYDDDIRPAAKRLWNGAKHEAAQLERLFRDDLETQREGTSMPTSELGLLTKQHREQAPDEQQEEYLAPVRQYGRALGRRSHAM